MIRFCLLVLLASGSVAADETSPVGPAGATVTPDPSIQAIVEAVSPDTIRTCISRLSGNEPVLIGGELDTLLSRYSFNSHFDRAAEYIYERFEDYGMAVEYQTYVSCDFHFLANCSPCGGICWAVGSAGRIFKTTDGGAAWTRQTSPVPDATLRGVDFADSATGWLVGSSGTILHTTNGGADWTAQSSGTSLSLNDATALDADNAWAVGSGGTVRRTVDGGAAWTGVASGITSDLCACDFVSNSRGWMVGNSGAIRFWDGSASTGQTSGTTATLQDVCFANDHVGWIVGLAGVILKTVDGGQNWLSQTIPAGVDPNFAGVCFVDSLEGWIAGEDGAIIHTTDGGASWEIQNSGILYCRPYGRLRCVDFADSETGWAMGYNGVMVRTEDGGATWVDQRVNLPSPDVAILKNVVATKPGTVSTDEVIICGHADAISPNHDLAPGAEDNASGTVAAIEAARVMAPSSFKKTLKFCAWSGEEQGLVGSAEYAEAARSRGDVIVGVLNFDMIACVNPPIVSVDIISDESAAWLADSTVECASAYVPTLSTRKQINPKPVASDNYMFSQAGYDGLYIADRCAGGYPYYHTEYDTVGNLFPDHCAKVVKMAVAAAAELAEVDDAASVPGTEPAAVVSGVRARPNPCAGAASGAGVLGERGAGGVSGTRIAFTLSSLSPVAARIYDLRGREVKTLFEGSLPAGAHEIAWQGDSGEGMAVAAGVYFVAIETQAGKRSAKVVVLR